MVLMVAVSHKFQELYDEYLEREYQENAHFSARDPDGPDFVDWIEKNCLTFSDWILDHWEDVLNE